ncbi:hypothetical protein [Acinetobacter baumannii]|uniref:hypothetical protein n=1 Tax=Acinetobacter baumannii TaxID=470 RepID=UPI003B83D49E
MHAKKFLTVGSWVDMDAKDFKVGDLITYNESDFIYKIDTLNSDGFHATTVHPVKRCIIALFEHDNINHASPEEIKAGCRLDEDVVPVYVNPQFTYTVLTGAQVGSVLQLTPQIDDMGDDSNLDHHVSPFCEVRDV